eukprot:CAMPEP_0119127206 /NCGR_PEP_ID=MMETSP1310-20130426/5845_1 /TAXON_ID=464262 /ORGANISM="Genus nov. species nov., Strain RCC2339" /LENGTH=267 /DNA_ID=CAMNT_0007117445 /DNA_START=131 /DNA_END=934 /DNA_ORIENTATION=+
MSRQNLPILVDHIGDVIIQPGDVLVLEATDSFRKNYENSREFAVVVEMASGRSFTPRRKKSFSMAFVVVSTLLMIVLSAVGVIDIAIVSALVACLFVLYGVLTWEQALQSVKADVLLVIAAAFGLGNAMQETGLTDAISSSLLSVFEIAGPLGVLLGLFFTTALLSSVIANTAVCALLFPVALSFSGESTGLSAQACLTVLMVASSTCFATAVGYQTNLMILTPGGYTNTDFLRFGLPLTLLVMIVSCVVAWLAFPPYSVEDTNTTV